MLRAEVVVVSVGKGLVERRAAISDLSLVFSALNAVISAIRSCSGLMFVFGSAMLVVTSIPNCDWVTDSGC